MAMTVVTTQPGSALPQMWTSGICDCCQDIQSCCLGYWCPCFLACQVSSGLGEGLCLPLLDMLCGGIIPPVSLALRSSLRERYHIQGSVAYDCCMVTCCPICSWCQMARELKARRVPVQQTTTTTTFRHHANQAAQYPTQENMPAPGPYRPLLP